MTQTLAQCKFVSTDPRTTTTLATPIFRLFLRLAAAVAAVGFPEPLATISVPKAEELVATPYRHGSKEKAETVLPRRHDAGDAQPRHASSPGRPITIYYAFKQSETESEGTNQHRLGNLSRSRAEVGLVAHRHLADANRTGRIVSVSMGTNALASSIILVCRPRANGRRNDLAAAVRADAQRGACRWPSTP